MEDQKPRKPRRKRLARRKRPRHKLKIQTTVRIEEKLLKASEAQAEKKRLTVTDLIEDGLWLILHDNLQEDQIEELALDQSLMKVIPLHVRRLIRPFLTYMLTNFDDQFDNAIQRTIYARLAAFEKDPRHEAKMRELMRMVTARVAGRKKKPVASDATITPFVEDRSK